jgi:hypothetical protein
MKSVIENGGSVIVLAGLKFETFVVLITTVLVLSLLSVIFAEVSCFSVTYPLGRSAPARFTVRELVVFKLKRTRLWFEKAYAWI